MPKTKVPSGPWRIDPQKRSQVIDRFGRNVASVEPEIDASLIATAPDMLGLLEKLELEKDDAAISPTLREEIQFVLRKARGDFGLAVFPGGISRQNVENREWLKFIAALLKPHSATE
jgi:hypothetical protein